jgi:hypothetical protein
MLLFDRVLPVRPARERALTEIDDGEDGSAVFVVGDAGIEPATSSV